jgi:hypothetical protein
MASAAAYPPSLPAGEDVVSGIVPAGTPPLGELRRLPGVLRHLRRLTGYLPEIERPTAYVYVYAEPAGRRSRQGLRPFAPALETILARDRGVEGIACVDDVARAAVLGLRVFELTGSETACELATAWLRFLNYMQRRDDHRMLNFILDVKGTRNDAGETSYPGGAPWTMRSLRAFATAWRVLKDRDALRRFYSTALPVTPYLATNANYALAVMDIFETRPDDMGLRAWIEDLCETIIASGPGYFRSVNGQDDVWMYDYHQLEAVARAGRLLSRADYLAACEETVANLVEPVIRSGFTHHYPMGDDHQCVFDISSIAEGLEALYDASRNQRYRELALECCAWLDGNNPARAPMYNPETGRCYDKISLDGEIATGTGAESAIEAGYLHLVRCRLEGTRAGLLVAE